MLKREPTLGNTVEILGLASKLWREFGDKKKAAVVGQFAERLWANRDQPKKERSTTDKGLGQLKKLEDELAQLKAALEKKQAQLKKLQQGRDR